MTERKILIGLITKVLQGNEIVSVERIADYLLANGVMLVDTNTVNLVTNREPIQTAFGMPLDELADLIRAKQEGRIIVPPCKVGDKVFIPDRFGRIEAEIERTMELRHLIHITKRLAHAFPQSYINYNLEFIAHERANEYFRLEDCETELDVKCKVLEWLSRGAYKTCPFNSNLKNERFHNFMLNGINDFLGTDFTEDDMETIYTYLGNRCNHALTVEFVNSGYDMALLAERSGE